MFISGQIDNDPLRLLSHLDQLHLKMRSIVLSVSLNRTGTSHGIRRTGSPVERTEGEILNQLESSFRGVKNRSKVSDRRYNVGC